MLLRWHLAVESRSSSLAEHATMPPAMVLPPRRRDDMRRHNSQVMRYAKPGKAGRFTLTWGDQPLTIDASVSDDDVTEFKIVGRVNDPARVKAAQEFMAVLSRAGKTDGYTIAGHVVRAIPPAQGAYKRPSRRLSGLLRKVRLPIGPPSCARRHSCADRRRRQANSGNVVVRQETRRRLTRR